MENWALLNTNKDYVWVHLANVPSAHAVLETDDPRPEELEFARQCILQQTMKAPRDADIIHTKIRYVRRGSVPGEVILLSDPLVG